MDLRTERMRRTKQTQREHSASFMIAAQANREYGTGCAADQLMGGVGFGKVCRDYRVQLTNGHDNDVYGRFRREIENGIRCPTKSSLEANFVANVSTMRFSSPVLHQHERTHGCLEVVEIR